MRAARGRDSGSAPGPSRRRSVQSPPRSAREGARDALSRPIDPLADDRGDTVRWHRRRRDGSPAPRGATLVHRDSTLSRRPDETRQTRVDRLPTGDDAWLGAWPTLSRRPRARVRAGGRGLARGRGRPVATPATRHGRARAARTDSRGTQREPDRGVQGSPDPHSRQGRADVRRAQLIDMATVREHYDGVLAEHYTRMLGDFEAKVTEQRALLERLGVSARPSGGLLVLTFRDLSGELRDLDRVIPLGAWDDLVITCFLEYEASTVKVHDLIWVRQPDGWRFRKGVYRKLRLAPARVTARLTAAGFAVERHEAPAGLGALVGVPAGPA